MLNVSNFVILGLHPPFKPFGAYILDYHGLSLEFLLGCYCFFSYGLLSVHASKSPLNQAVLLFRQMTSCRRSAGFPVTVVFPSASLPPTYNRAAGLPPFVGIIVTSYSHYAGRPCDLTWILSTRSGYCTTDVAGAVFMCVHASYVYLNELH